MICVKRDFGPSFPVRHDFFVVEWEDEADVGQQIVSSTRAKLILTTVLEARGRCR